MIWQNDVNIFQLNRHVSSFWPNDGHLFTQGLLHLLNCSIIPILYIAFINHYNSLMAQTQNLGSNNYHIQWRFYLFQNAFVTRQEISTQWPWAGLPHQRAHSMRLLPPVYCSLSLASAFLASDHPNSGFQTTPAAASTLVLSLAWFNCQSIF